jgi:hypothetical protein
MAGQASTATTGGFVLQLKAKRQHEGEDTFEERLPIAKQLKICRCALEIDGDGAVFAGLASQIPPNLVVRRFRRVPIAT